MQALEGGHMQLLVLALHSDSLLLITGSQFTLSVHLNQAYAQLPIAALPQPVPNLHYHQVRHSLKQQSSNIRPSSSVMSKSSLDLSGFLKNCLSGWFISSPTSFLPVYLLHLEQQQAQCNLHCHGDIAAPWGITDDKSCKLNLSRPNRRIVLMVQLLI